MSTRVYVLLALESERICVDGLEHGNSLEKKGNRAQ